MLNRRCIMLLGVSVVITALAPLLFGGFDAWRGLFRIPAWGAALVLAMIVGAWVCNAFRIHQLAGAVGLRLRPVEAFRFTLSAEFAGMASPAFVGGPATSLWLFHRRGLSPGPAGAILAAEEVIGLTFFATGLPFMLLLSLGGAGLNMWVFVLALMPVVGVLALGVAAHHYRPLAIWLGRLFRRLPWLHRFRWRLARGMLRFRQAVWAMLVMGRWRLIRIYVVCCMHWLLRYGALPVLLVLLGEPQPFAWLFLLQAVILLTGHLTVMPGGAGGVEAAFALLLGGTIAAGTLGTALLAWRFATFHWYLLVGAPVFLATVGRSARRDETG